MKRPSLLCFLIFCMVLGTVIAQPSSDQQPWNQQNADSLEWQTVRQSIVLLRNAGELLPLKKLDVNWFSWESFGLGEANTFEETLQNYRPESPLRPYSNEEGVVLVAFTTDEAEQAKLTVQALGKGALPASKRSRLVVVLFGDPLVISDWSWVESADALLLVPEHNSLSQSLAAQAIFGGCAISGKLHTAIPPYFRQHDGLTITSVRLGFGPPALVGLDAQLLTDSIQAIVEAGIRAAAFPGAQVLVVKDGLLVFHETYGYHTYDSLQAVRPTDLYDFASVTKVTSTLPALMKLYGEGKFDLDAPLKCYLPYFKKSDKADITYRQLLAHHGRLKPSIVFWRAAMDGHGGWKKRSFRSSVSRRYPIRITDSLFLFKNYNKQIYKSIRKLPLNPKPGYVYSDLSFLLYPAVVERLTKQPLEPYLKETFYRPLGAFTLTYNPLLSYPQARIVPTERDTFFRKKQIHGTVHDETAAMLGGVSGHAGLFGAVGDLAKLLQMYLNGGTYGGERFISEAAVREFARCQYCEEGNRRGLGFDKPMINYDAVQRYVARSASPESFGHSGYTGTFFWVDPKYNLVVIFFSNRVYPYRSHTGISDLNIRPRVQQVVYDAFR